MPNTSPTNILSSSSYSTDAWYPLYSSIELIFIPRMYGVFCFQSKSSKSYNKNLLVLKIYSDCKAFMNENSHLYYIESSFHHCAAADHMGSSAAVYSYKIVLRIIICYLLNIL